MVATTWVQIIKACMLLGGAMLVSLIGLVEKRTLKRMGMAR